LSAVIGRGISLFFNAHPLACIITAGLIILFPRLTSAHQVTLAWDPNTEPDLYGYIAYWGTSSRNYPYLTDVGNITTHTITGLQEGQVYYFAVTAYDSDYNEGGYSDEVVYAVSSPDTGGTADEDSGGGGCFIATAAFGSPMENHVMILRQFRDKFLLPNKIGRAVRWSLLPIVVLCWLTLTFGFWTVLAAFVILPSAMAAIPIFVIRRRKILTPNTDSMGSRAVVVLKE
jgi:hypothetical protein